MARNVVWFEEIGLADINEVGGKNTSLGEMIRHLSEAEVSVPPGFSTTIFAFREFIEHNQLTSKIESELTHLKAMDIEAITKSSTTIKKWIVGADFPSQFESDVANSYRELERRYPSKGFAVAVRSSATAEDLAHASFAGQQETFLFIKGLKNVLTAIKGVYASLYSPRAIAYRFDMGFEHTKIAVAAGIQCMIRSDVGVSGVMFTLDTESGFQDVILINSSYGLGEAIVQGSTNPDEFYVHKPMLIQGNQDSIIKKSLGSKKHKIILSKDPHVGKTTRTASVPKRLRQEFSLNHKDIITLAKYALAIEKHYKKPMDIEWGKDGVSGKLFILQARPETVKSYTDHQKIDSYKLKTKSKILTRGLSIGQKISKGKVCFIKKPSEISVFKPGHILVTDITDPSWEPILRLSGAVITNRGGRTCHAAIVARELGIPAIVGCSNATNILKNGMDVTVSCSEGSIGYVYEGLLEHEIITTHLGDLQKCPVKINMNIGNPEIAFQSQFTPNDGVGLARLEFIIGSMIGIHPKLVLDYPNIPLKYIKKIKDQSAGYPDPKTFYIEKLAEGIATIAASFWPKPVIVRLSDFKTNEYRELMGGELYEPIEENPMIGWRGASRYITPSFSPCFALECVALRHVREKMGLKNVEVMIPFVRTVEECQDVIKALEAQGLKRGLHGLRIIMMCEIPSNALNADEFLKHVDGYSIGSNDMTQLTLGIDRDSEIMSGSFNEKDPAAKAIFKMAIAACNKANKPIGICGQAPSDYVDFAEWLVKEGITSISLNPDSVIKTRIALSKIKMTST